MVIHTNYNKFTMEIEILNVRLPSELSKWLDSLVKEGIYKSRSEAIRDFSRDYLVSINKMGDKNE